MEEELCVLMRLALRAALHKMNVLSLKGLVELLGGRPLE